jgi:hypothetical protein
MKKAPLISSLETLILPRSGQRRRESSYDRTGGNDDRIYLKPGEIRTIANLSGAGIITHLWMTHVVDAKEPEPFSFRKIVLRCFWDGETNPSVLAPLGDFFGMGHGISKNFVSAPLQMSPEDGKGLNSWWPMPFANGARIEIQNDCDNTVILYYYVDYESLDTLPEEVLRFHAVWHRECPTNGITASSCATRPDWLFGGKNTDGAGNYVILDAEGRGHYCGCNINIHNLEPSGEWDWPGEGDDMIFIDGEPWPPRLHGTGTEDYVAMAWCPTQEYNAPFHGLILGGKSNWKGKITYYRYHIQDPVMFEKSIQVTIEHGHANHRNDDWSTTAYWYQTEPHRTLSEILPVQARLPLPE